MTDGARSTKYMRGRMGGRKLTDEQIVELYTTLRDSVAVGEAARCSGTTVLHIMHATGNSHLVSKRGGGVSKQPRPMRLTEAQIVERYQAGTSLRDVCDQSGGTHRRISGILKAAKVPIRDCITQRRMGERK
jgi:hypothetical protein